MRKIVCVCAVDLRSKWKPYRLTKLRLFRRMFWISNVDATCESEPDCHLSRWELAFSLLGHNAICMAVRMNRPPKTLRGARRRTTARSFINVVHIVQPSCSWPSSPSLPTHHPESITSFSIPRSVPLSPHVQSILELLVQPSIAVSTPDPT